LSGEAYRIRVNAVCDALEKIIARRMQERGFPYDTAERDARRRAAELRAVLLDPAQLTDLRDELMLAVFHTSGQLEAVSVTHLFMTIDQTIRSLEAIREK
jgi:hypothetical protein